MNTIQKAEKTVTVAVAAATATGAIPIPFADAPLLIGEQAAMMAAIAKIFKINIKEDGLKTLVSAALGVGGATLVGKTVVSSIWKFIPGLGWFIGGAISGAAAGALTYGIGHAFIEVCKAIRLGRMNEDDLTSKDGVAVFVGYFKDMIKKRKKENPVYDVFDSFDDGGNFDGDEEDEGGEGGEGV